MCNYLRNYLFPGLFLVKTVCTVVVVVIFAINIITIEPNANLSTCPDRNLQTSYLAKNIILFQDSITLKSVVSVRCYRDTVTGCCKPFTRL